MMAWFAGVRRSTTRWFKRVSRPTVTSPSLGSFSFRDASTIWNGRSGTALETTKHFLTASSTSPCEQAATDAAATVASTSTMDSDEILPKNPIMALGTPPSPAAATACSVKQLWRRTRNARLPLARIAWTRPRTQTVDPTSGAATSRMGVQRRAVIVADMQTPVSPKTSAPASSAFFESAASACAFFARSCMRSSFFEGLFAGAAPAGFFSFFFFSWIACGCAGSSAVISFLSASSSSTAALISSAGALLVFNSFTLPPAVAIDASNSATDAPIVSYDAAILLGEAVRCLCESVWDDASSCDAAGLSAGACWRVRLPLRRV
mmetsp:Transcript_18213/g.56059  ORF Transcript_18213/g.56059 Transcript_18213/m.56059 type:complete len:321 (+) Transcript_18213:1027-1989(+)